VSSRATWCGLIVTQYAQGCVKIGTEPPRRTIDVQRRSIMRRLSGIVTIMALTAACSNSAKLSSAASSERAPDAINAATEPVDTSSAEPETTESATSDTASRPGPSWTPPDDPHAEGPTEAPALAVESGDLDETLELSTDMTVSIDSVVATTVTAETPGEVSGSALIVTVSLTNVGSEPQSIDSAVVTVVADNGDLAIPTTAGPNNPFGGEVLPGQSATGQYVYMLDPAKGRSITVSVNYSAGAPVAEFSGEVL
jgi:hypothetical protein